jgi:hypothetical protein
MTHFQSLGNPLDEAELVGRQWAVIDSVFIGPEEANFLKFPTDCEEDIGVVPISLAQQPAILKVILFGIGE